MIEALVEEDRQANKPVGPRKSIPQTRGGAVPVGGHDFVRLAMAETGCSEAVAVAAVRLIVRRRRPQLGQLRGYLARFSHADRLYWVDRARWLDPAAAIDELTVGWGLSRSEAVDVAAAGRARALAARAFARAERERVGGLRLLDAELERLSASSPAAASVIAAVGRDLEPLSGGGDNSGSESGGGSGGSASGSGGSASGSGGSASGSGGGGSEGGGGSGGSEGGGGSGGSESGGGSGGSESGNGGGGSESGNGGSGGER